MLTDNVVHEDVMPPGNFSQAFNGFSRGLNLSNHIEGYMFNSHY